MYPTETPTLNCIPWIRTIGISKDDRTRSKSKGKTFRGSAFSGYESSAGIPLNSWIQFWRNGLPDCLTPTCPLFWTIWNRTLYGVLEEILKCYPQKLFYGKWRPSKRTLQYSGWRMNVVFGQSCTPTGKHTAIRNPTPQSRIPQSTQKKTRFRITLIQKNDISTLAKILWFGARQTKKLDLMPFFSMQLSGLAEGLLNFPLSFGLILNLETFFPLFFPWWYHRAWVTLRCDFGCFSPSVGMSSFYRFIHG